MAGMAASHGITAMVLKRGEVMEIERVIVDGETGLNVDQHLEVAFGEVYDGDGTNEDIGHIVDEYAKAAFGEAHIRFEDALTCAETAIKWASQFGPVTITALDEEERQLHISQGAPKSIGWKAVIAEATFTVGTTMPQTIVLAGIQVLREYAYALLNQQSGALKH